MTDFKDHVLAVINSHYPFQNLFNEAAIAKRLLGIERDIRRQFPQADVSGEFSRSSVGLTIDYTSDKAPGGGKTGRARVLVNCEMHDRWSQIWRVVSVQAAGLL